MLHILSRRERGAHATARLPTRVLAAASVLAWVAACHHDATDDGGGGSGTSSPQVFVNEAMPDNATVEADETGAFPDWVEIYNAEDTDYPLAGCWISDDATNAERFELPSDAPIVPAHGYTILFLDDDEEQGPQHVAFSLSKAGGDDIALFASDAHGHALLDVVYDLELAVEDQSFGRAPDGGGEWQRMVLPTPGEPNAEPAAR
jgi:hypothetical protein